MQKINELRLALANLVLAQFATNGIARFPRLADESNDSYMTRVLDSTATNRTKCTVLALCGIDFQQVKKLMPTACPGQLIREYEFAIIETGFDYDLGCKIVNTDNQYSIYVNPNVRSRSITSTAQVYTVSYTCDGHFIVASCKELSYQLRVECNYNWDLNPIVELCNANAKADATTLENLLDSDSVVEVRASKTINRCNEHFKKHALKLKLKAKKLAKVEPLETANPQDVAETLDSTPKVETPKRQKSA